MKTKKKSQQINTKGTNYFIITNKVEGKTETWNFSVAKLETGAMRPETSKL